jgi:hypothetical protein
MTAYVAPPIKFNCLIIDVLSITCINLQTGMAVHVIVYHALIKAVVSVATLFLVL